MTVRANGSDPRDADGPRQQKIRMRRMFDAVAPRYDLLNRLLSAGVDRGWRRRAVRALELAPGMVLADICAGTGDLGLAALKAEPGVRVVGVDLAREMLARGAQKSSGAACDYVQGDAENLPLADASVDRVCVGFGIRNVASVSAAAREAARVLRPGGRYVVLEFSTPPNPLFRRVYETYFHHVLPRVGGWISGRPEAYRYLPESVGAFPAPPQLAGILGDAGFSRVEWARLHGGIAALHVGTR